MSDDPERLERRRSENRRRAKAWYASPEQQARRRAMVEAARQARRRPCLVCGVEFIPTRAQQKTHPGECRRLHHNAVHRRNVKARPPSPERKAKKDAYMKEYAREYRRRPEVVAYRRLYRQTPEYKAKRRAAYLRKKAGGTSLSDGE